MPPFIGVPYGWLLYKLNELPSDEPVKAPVEKVTVIPLKEVEVPLNSIVDSDA